jgi:hypothetical protein
LDNNVKILGRSVLGDSNTEHNAGIIDGMALEAAVQLIAVREGLWILGGS